MFKVLNNKNAEKANQNSKPFDIKKPTFAELEDIFRPEDDEIGKLKNVKEIKKTE